jgi:hypothetical protein
MDEAYRTQGKKLETLVIKFYPESLKVSVHFALKSQVIGLTISAL